ncbi:MAG: hypothetical protein ISS43_03320 [Candidatus Omnitrophica bacterium]|nr:hypothetical protein [Candidatus Omnitrophota bacterium]
MDKIERLIKEYLGRNLNKTEKTDLCLSEQVLMDYFQQKLSREDCQSIENHLASCGFCLSQLNLLFEAEKLGTQAITDKVPTELVQKAKALVKDDKNHRGRMKRVKKNLFLAGTVIFFIASFLLPRYFAQCLVAALILGMRWAFESEAGRTLIMVLDSWRRHSHDEDDQISRRLKDRSKSFHL